MSEAELPERVYHRHGRGVYHLDPDCGHGPDEGRYISRETADSWGFDLCQYCDPSFDIGTSHKPCCESCGKRTGYAVPGDPGTMLCALCRDSSLGGDGR
jgi:hypothetical protein